MRSSCFILSIASGSSSSVYLYSLVIGQRAGRFSECIFGVSIPGLEPVSVCTRLKGVDFTNGTIEVKVLSRLLPDAPEMARGFIGVAFRINDSNTKYESIYLRPLNARVSDQVRRNHTIQYYSYPDYKFDRLRKIAPQRYESYTDMEMNRWITMRIEIKGAQANCLSIKIGNLPL